MTRHLRRLGGALPDLAIGYAYLTVVADAALRTGTQGTALWRAMVIEFFAIHASGFLKWTWVSDWSRARRVRFVLVLAAGYSAATGLAALLLGGWWPLVVFWSLTANRMLDAAVREAPEGRAMQEEARAWAGGVALYGLAVCVAAVTGFGRAAVLTAGAAYFFANGVSELTGWRWVDRWLAWSRARGSR